MNIVHCSQREDRAVVTSSRGLRVYWVRCVLLYVYNDIHRPLPRVYKKYTWVGDFDTPTHQPTSMYVHMCIYYGVIIFLHLGDEMFSDIYKIRLIGDVLYEVEGKVYIHLHVHIFISIKPCLYK